MNSQRSEMARMWKVDRVRGSPGKGNVPVGEVVSAAMLMGGKGLEGLGIMAHQADGSLQAALGTQETQPEQSAH